VLIAGPETAIHWGGQEVDIADYLIRVIADRQDKAAIADQVLRSLPDWFGIEDARVAYVQTSQDLPFWAAYVEACPVGFLSLQRHNAYTSEIFCMGIEQAFHRHGIGKALVSAAIQFSRDQGSEFLTVKTLDASRSDEGYARTREFYQAMGFRPLEVFPTLWGEDNPCLFMAKYLAG
jgi:GNAT superfamily N-acetyltransferase